jgi:hypothetical protein
MEYIKPQIMLITIYADNSSCKLYFSIHKPEASIVG